MLPYRPMRLAGRQKLTAISLATTFAAPSRAEEVLDESVWSIDEDAIRALTAPRHPGGSEASAPELLILNQGCRLNRQPWHFIVIRDKDLQKKLADFLGLHPYFETAPVLIAAAARPEVSTTWRMDVSAAIENMLIAATAMGLGTAWVGEPDSMLWGMAEEMLRDALHIPTELGVRIPALIAVGYPARERPPHGKHDRFDRTKAHYGVWEGRRLGE